MVGEYNPEYNSSYNLYGLELDTAVELLKWFKHEVDNVRLVQEYELVKHYYHNSCGYMDMYYIIVDWTDVPEDDMDDAMDDAYYWKEDSGTTERGKSLKDIKRWDDAYDISEFMVWNREKKEFINKEDWREVLEI